MHSAHYGGLMSWLAEALDVFADYATHSVFQPRSVGIWGVLWSIEVICATYAFRIPSHETISAVFLR